MGPGMMPPGPGMPGMPPHPGMMGMPQQQPQVSGRTWYGLWYNSLPCDNGCTSPLRNDGYVTLPILERCTVTLTFIVNRPVETHFDSRSFLMSSNVLAIGSIFVSRN